MLHAHSASRTYYVVRNRIDQKDNGKERKATLVPVSKIGCAENKMKTYDSMSPLISSTHYLRLLLSSVLPLNATNDVIYLSLEGPIYL